MKFTSSCFCLYIICWAGRKSSWYFFLLVIMILAGINMSVNRCYHHTDYVLPSEGGTQAVDTKTLARFCHRCGSGSSSCCGRAYRCRMVFSSCVGLLSASVLCIPPGAHITHKTLGGKGVFCVYVQL